MTDLFIIKLYFKIGILLKTCVKSDSEYAMYLKYINKRKASDV